MIIGITVSNFTWPCFVRVSDEIDEFVLDPDTEQPYQEPRTFPTAWITLGSTNVGPTGRITAVFRIWPSRTSPFPVADDLIVDVADDHTKHPSAVAWADIIDPEGIRWAGAPLWDVDPAPEVVSVGLPPWWGTLGHDMARIRGLLSPQQHSMDLRGIDYDKVLGLVSVEVWDKGIQIRNDCYDPDDIVGYDPSGGPIPRQGALPPVSEYLDRADDPAGRKTIVWWQRFAGAPPKDIPPNLLAINPVYAYKRRAPNSNAEEKEIEWRTKVVARVLRVAAAGIVGYYAPQHPEHNPATPDGLRALLDIERGYLYDEQQRFIGRGGSELYVALEASGKPWLDLPGQGGFATLRARILDELTPWKPAE